MSGAGTVASPFTADGLSIVVSGTANSGDSYLIQPTADAPAGLSVLLTSPSQIASSAALQTTAASTNSGTGTISSATVKNSASTNLLDSVSIAFTSPTNYTITDTTTGASLGSGTYTAGQPITGNGWQVAISGAPAAGDSFTVSSNSGNTGDNTNLLAMISAMSSNSLNGGTTSLSGAANALVSQVGVLTQQAQNNSSAQQSVFQSATDSLNQVSGVNLDAEAAKMVAYQQAYQACAEVIQTSNQMFNSLITAING
jgi:flagellar hook-associated protein 1 FlgK